jgi:hypothetical protein
MVRATVSVWWVSVSWHKNLGIQCHRPFNRTIDFIDFEPQKQSISGRHIVGVTNWPVMMIFLPSRQL